MYPSHLVLIDPLKNIALKRQQYVGEFIGKFDGKADEGFFVGYSLNSKAFRVFNSKTRIVEENLHIRFSENTPNVVDPKSSQDDGSKPSNDDEKKFDEDLRKDGESIDQEKDDNVNSTNNVNVSSTNEVNVVSGKTSIELPDDPNMPALEDISIFNLSRDNEDIGAEANMNNLDTTIQVSPIPTIRIHKDHPLDQVIGDLQSATQTRNMSKNLEEHGFEEPKKVIHALKDPSWIDAMQEELLQFKLQEFWTLVDLPNEKRAIGTKWVFRNKKDERGIVIRNNARLVAQGYTQEEGIDYDEVFAPVARIEAIRIFLAYSSFNDFVVYQMDVKGVFIYANIKEKVYMSSIGELTFFLRLQVQQKKDGIFISQDKYVEEILKKFGFTEVKTASTPIETQKPFPKDENGEEVAVHMYRSMIGSLTYLTSSRPDIMFAVYACARYQVNPKVSHLHDVKRIFSARNRQWLQITQQKLNMWLLQVAVDKTELVEESSKNVEAEIANESSLKRAGEELEQESSKKQKLEEEKESEELKQCLEMMLKIMYGKESTGLVDYESEMAFEFLRLVKKQLKEGYVLNEVFRSILLLKEFDLLKWDPTRGILHPGTTQEKLQDDCDVQATNIVLKGLPPDVYSLVNHCQAAKDIWDRVKLLMQGTELSYQERECKLYNEFDKCTYVKGESLYEYYLCFAQLINDMHIIGMTMQQVQVNTKFMNAFQPEWSKFVTNVKLAKNMYNTNFDKLYAYLSQHERHANEARMLRERYPDPLALDGRVTVQQVQGRQGQNFAGIGTKGNATSSGGNNVAGQARAYEFGQELDEEQLAFQADLGILDAKAVLMANLSSYDTNVLSKVNQMTKTVNESLTVELEGYKERVKNLKQRLNINLSSHEKMIDSQMDDMIRNRNALKQEIDSLKQTLSKQVKEKESLLQTFTVFKKESKEKENKYMDKEIDLEKKIKELDYICEQLDVTQTPVEIEVPKELLNCFVNKKYFDIQKKEHSLDNDRLLDHIICQDMMNIVMYVDFVPVNVLSANNKCPVNDNLEIERLEQENDHLFKLLLSQDKVHICVNSLASLNDRREMQQGFIHEYNENLMLKVELAKKEHMVEKKFFDEVVLRCSRLENHSANLELKLRHQKERMKSSTSASRSQPSDNTKNNRISRTTSSNPKNKVEDHPRSVKSNSNKKNHVIEHVCNVNVKHTMLNANFELIYVKCNQCMFDVNHDVCFLEFVNDVNVRSKSKSAKRSKKKNFWKPTGKVFTDIGYRWKPTGRTFTINGNTYPLTRITSTKVVPLKETTSKSVITQNPEVKVYSRRTKVTKSVDVPSSSLVDFRFGNNQIAKIMGYGDYQMGKVMISRVYYVEGLGHNLFSVGQFCDSDLVVPFCKHTCYIRDLEGVDLLKGLRGSNLYTLSVEDMMLSYPICLLFKASKTKSWLWHRSDSEDLGKLNPKADIRIFVSYSPTKKAFRIYNKRTHLITKTIHVDFDEMAAMASEQFKLADSTGIPSSTHIDQDAPSLSTSQAHQESQSPVISFSFEEHSHDIEVSHLDNDPFFGVLIPEPNSEESSSRDTSSTNESLICYFVAFLTSIKPKNYKEALKEACWIEAMQEELNEFDRLEL
ncbi:putative ribonuclease H-like domain-containing protein [Tanacetum coccineum]